MKKKLFLGLPVYGGYDPHFIESLLQLVQRPPCDMIIRSQIGDSLVARARNNLAARFLASDCTHLLFLDTDLVFSPEHIAKLISHLDTDHVHVVAGLYPKKQRELGWVCNMLEEPQTERPDGLVRVKYAGTGCLCISRGVFDLMREHLPEIEYDPDAGDTPGVKWDFFATGVRAFDLDNRPVVPSGELKPPLRRYLSEDWMFCQRVLDLGLDVFVDPSVVLKHVGQFVYPFDDEATIQAAQAAA